MLRHVMPILACGLLHVPTVARAACNQIPSTDVIRTQAIVEGLLDPGGLATGIAAELERRSGGGALPFKGALGRVSRAVVFPDPHAGFAVAPDGICVSGQGASPVASAAGKDDLVGVIISPTRAGAGDGSPVYARIFASRALCDALTDAVARDDGRRDPAWYPLGEGVRLVRDCSNARVRFEKSASADVGPYVLHLPAELPPAADDVSGNVRIAVFRASTVGAVTDRLSALADPARKCAALCGDHAAIDAGLDVCIDDLYETLLAVPPSGPAKYVLDSVGCNIAIPPGLTCNANDYRALCTGPNEDPGLAQCAATGTELQFWQSNCGSAHFPFTYADIRKDAVAMTPVDRILKGFSGTGRKKNGDAVYLPGSEFVGATLCVSHCADPPCTNAGDWRLPQLDVWYESGSTAVVGLAGVADKDESVIVAAPALKAMLVCDVADKEACTGVEYRLGKRQIVCACADRYPATCQCKEASPPEFFACEGPPGQTGTYAHAGMPCTRHNHCPGGGYCKASPKCRPRGQHIWGDNGAAGADCQNDGQCPGNQACGFRLFDLADAAGDKFHKNITGTGSTQDRRGSCEDDVKKGCKQKADCATEDCEGFHLEAKGKVADVP